MNKKIKFINPDLILDKNIAIIGSSAKLLENSYGEDIDSYSEIEGFNRAPVNGYERFAVQTTLRIVNESKCI